MTVIKTEVIHISPVKALDWDPRANPLPLRVGGGGKPQLLAHQFQIGGYFCSLVPEPSLDLTVYAHHSYPGWAHLGANSRSYPPPVGHPGPSRRLGTGIVRERNYKLF